MRRAGAYSLLSDLAGNCSRQQPSGLAPASDFARDLQVEPASLDILGGVSVDGADGRERIGLPQDNICHYGLAVLEPAVKD
jgi:hypothetical protein